MAVCERFAARANQAKRSARLLKLKGHCYLSRSVPLRLRAIAAFRKMRWHLLMEVSSGVIRVKAGRVVLPPVMWLPDGTCSAIAGCSIVAGQS